MCLISTHMDITSYGWDDTTHLTNTRKLRKLDLRWTEYCTCFYDMMLNIKYVTRKDMRSSLLALGDYNTHSFILSEVTIERYKTIVGSKISGHCPVPYNHVTPTNSMFPLTCPIILEGSILVINNGLHNIHLIIHQTQTINCNLIKNKDQQCYSDPNKKH
jgi:hypothetical protein